MGLMQTDISRHSDISRQCLPLSGPQVEIQPATLPIYRAKLVIHSVQGGFFSAVLHESSLYQQSMQASESVVLPHSGRE